MKILVTGAAGFIGSYVCQSLLHRGNEKYLEYFSEFVVLLTKLTGMPLCTHPLRVVL